ncbi:hypothetical protein P8610_11860 [Fictibacillus sp. UD]
MVVVEGGRLLRDRRAGETLIRLTYECGSPPAPRKASTWTGNQLLPKATMDMKTAFLIMIYNICVKNGQMRLKSYKNRGVMI